MILDALVIALNHADQLLIQTYILASILQIVAEFLHVPAVLQTHLCTHPNGCTYSQPQSVGTEGCSHKVVLAHIRDGNRDQTHEIRMCTCVDNKKYKCIQKRKEV